MATAEAHLRQAFSLNAANYWVYDVYMNFLVEQRRPIDVLLLMMQVSALLGCHPSDPRPTCPASQHLYAARVVMCLKFEETH